MKATPVGASETWLRSAASRSGSRRDLALSPPLRLTAALETEAPRDSRHRASSRGDKRRGCCRPRSRRSIDLAYGKRFGTSRRTHRAWLRTMLTVSWTQGAGRPPQPDYCAFSPAAARSSAVQYL
ncbi:hypothetical protein GN956_G13416 [Arapaima gigas]